MNKQENHILNIRLSYYRKIRSQVELILGKTAKELKNYTQQYEDELKNCRYKPILPQVFFKSARNADILLIGDFHAQPQSARALLRICRKLGAQHVVLALECFRSQDQAYINSYMRSELSESDFLDQIQWEKNWGFPWEHTRTLIKWAIQNKVPVFGINLAGSNKSLKLRDKHFSQHLYRICNHSEVQIKSKIIVAQVGDFHLARKHLPLELKKLNKKLNIQSVYQSPDALYFKSMKKNLNMKAQKASDFLDLGDHRWALMTVVPWVKWQDYLLYLESGFDKSVSADDRGEFDVTDHVDRFVNLMIHSLQIDMDSKNLSVYSSQDPQLSKSLKKLEPGLRRKVKQDMNRGSSFYIPELEIGVISRLTVNHISRVAAQFILYKLGVYVKSMTHTKLHFLKLIWLEMLTYFMSKMVNPKRKTDTLMDIRNALSHAAFEDNGKQALALSLEQKMREIEYINSGALSKRKARASASQNYVIASEILGGVLGEKTFYAFSKKIIRFPAAKVFLFKDLNQKTFESSYYESIEVIDSWPSPFKSKYDQF